MIDSLLIMAILVVIIIFQTIHGTRLEKRAKEQDKEIKQLLTTLANK